MEDRNRKKNIYYYIDFFSTNIIFSADAMTKMTDMTEIEKPLKHHVFEV